MRIEAEQKKLWMDSLSFSKLLFSDMRKQKFKYMNEKKAHQSGASLVILLVLLNVLIQLCNLIVIETEICILTASKCKTIWCLILRTQAISLGFADLIFLNVKVFEWAIALWSYSLVHNEVTTARLLLGSLRQKRIYPLWLQHSVAIFHLQFHKIWPWPIYTDYKKYRFHLRYNKEWIQRV